MRLRSLILVVLLVACARALPAQQVTVELAPSGGAVLPLGPPVDATDTSLFGLGGGGALAVNVRGVFMPRMLIQGAVGYSAVPAIGGGALSLVTLGAGAGIGLRPADRIAIDAVATSGLYLGAYGGSLGFNPYVGAHGVVSYRFSPTFSLGLHSGWRACLTGADTGVRALYHGMDVGVAGTIGFSGGTRRSRVEIREIRIDPIFPIQYNYYDEHEFGQIALYNGENGTIRDVEVTFFVQDLMDSPRVCERIPAVASGETVMVGLRALFNDTIMGITQATKATAQIRVEYTIFDETVGMANDESVRVFDRNAVTWDDDNRVAAFVTDKEPFIVSLSRNVSGFIRAYGSGVVDPNLRCAIGAFEVLRESGIEYAPDPSTPYAEFSTSSERTDYVQFPVQTLSYGGGDCDDIAVLYNAILESMGVPSAFITIPGHIYVACALRIPEAEARRTFLYPDDLIYEGDQVWLPLETTALSMSFADAWRVGAEQWRSADDGVRAILPVADAWLTYPPVIRPEDPLESSPRELPLSVVRTRYESTLDTLVKREIEPRVAELETRIRESGNDQRYINRLGTLYARYGLYDDALAHFRRLDRGDAYEPALLNIANIHLLRREYERARQYYSRVIESDTRNVAARVGLYRALDALGEERPAQQALAQAREIDPDEVAMRLSVLRSTEGRASSIADEEMVIWNEEE